MISHHSADHTETYRQTFGAKDILWLGAFLAITFLAAAFGGQWGAGEWYKALHKPSYNPPGWIFGPVWTLLYILMAVAAWLTWHEKGFRRAKVALAAYAIQLVLNGLWSFLFFGRHLIGVALIEIYLLWIAILVTTVLFWRIRRLAGALMIPYLLWVAFASLLNLQLYRLNP